jgi:homoserine dehydrogenase
MISEDLAERGDELRSRGAQQGEQFALTVPDEFTFGAARYKIAKLAVERGPLGGRNPISILGKGKIGRLMRSVQMIQVGIGTVGGEVIAQVMANRERWRQRLGLNVQIVALARGGGALRRSDRGALSDDVLRQALDARQAGRGLEQVASGNGASLEVVSLMETVDQHTAAGQTMVLDAAAGEQTAAADARALAIGAGVVLSNKAPLAMPLDDRTSAALWAATGTGGRLRYEATCGAGLPVLSTLKTLLDTEDEVFEIQGALSGTLGAIFSDVASGASFSDAVRSAKERGYTEPDPRDDLSGLDVARKALILARTMGRNVDLADIQVESLVPEHLVDCTVHAFLEQIGILDQSMAERAKAASDAGETLKYIATVSASGQIRVGVQGISTSSVLGTLQGPENIISMRTRRYDDYPLAISGPGAGAAVTAAGMLGDVLSLTTSL